MRIINKDVKAHDKPATAASRSYQGTRVAMPHFPPGTRRNVAHRVNARNRPRYCSLKTSQPICCGTSSRKEDPSTGIGISRSTINSANRGLSILGNERSLL